MEHFRQQMRRFDPKRHGLPWETLSECDHCRKPVPAKFLWQDGQVVLQRRCPEHGEVQILHEDAIFDTSRVSDRDGSPAETLCGTRIQPHLRGLPRTVETLCPECCAVVLGRYFQRDGAVWIEKSCPEHGYFQDKINSDAELYLRTAAISFGEPPGVSNPRRTGASRCPSDCGLCNQHQSISVLAQIDLTTRCNLACPICFANANARSSVAEPSFEEVVTLLEAFRAQRPIPCTAVQFSGGEPTLHPRFLDICRKAHEMGFSHIQAATNGLCFAEEDFARRAAEAHLHTLYLQFDGLNDEVYVKTRGEPLLDLKLGAIENCRQAGLKICLVPTIVRGLNDDQVGPILQFAMSNVDVISSINYQPVCFTGRIQRRDLAEKRYTLGDMAHGIAEASDAELDRDFFPVSLAVPLSRLLHAITGKPKIMSSCHTDCAMGTYFLVDPDGRGWPFPKVFDIKSLFTEMDALATKLMPRAGRLGWFDKLRIYFMFRRHFRKHSAPEGMTPWRYIRTLMGMVDKAKGRGKAERHTYKTLMAAGMHFMDRYNYDVERVKRCVIQYATPEGLFPFCTYNGGPAFRRFTDEAAAVPREQWKQSNPGVGLMEPGWDPHNLPDRTPRHRRNEPRPADEEAS